ncbi:condensation domain-containing protein [Micromonospora sp. M12]
MVSREVTLPLDVEVLRQALDHVVRRHPILRTRFDLGGYSEPLQLVEEQATVEVELDDLRGLSDEEVAARRGATMEKLGRPFDLDCVPLLRAHAAPSGPERFRLTYAFHHAILDGWSESVLALELIKTYQAMLRQEQPSLASPAPFSEFVRLERAALADEGSGGSSRDSPKGRATAESGSLAGGATRTPRFPARTAARGRVPGHARGGVGPTDQEPGGGRLLHRRRIRVRSCPGGRALDERPAGAAGADLTLGLFLNHLPLRLASSGATWRQLAQQAFEAERELLPQRRFRTPRSSRSSVVAPSTWH